MSPDSAITVLMPARNAAATAPAAARSTLRALRPGDRLLVHDDASQDGTGDALRLIDDSRLEVHRVEEPVGVAAGLTRLLDRTESGLVARMDADDVTLPWRFVHQRHELQRGADLVFSGHVRFGSTLRDLKQKRPGRLSAAGVNAWLALENPLLHPAMTGRTEVLRAAGGYRPGAAEDYDLWLRSATHGARIVRLLSPGLAYRMHSAQVTRGVGYGLKVQQDQSLTASHRAHAEALGWDGGSVWDVLNAEPVSARDWARKARYWEFLRRLAADLQDPFERRAMRATIGRAWPGVPLHRMAG